MILQVWKKHNFWLAISHGLADQKFFYFQTLLNLEKKFENKTKNVLQNGWCTRKGERENKGINYMFKAPRY